MYMSLKTLDGYQHSPIEATIKMDTIHQVQIIGRFPIPICKGVQFYMGLHESPDEPPKLIVPVSHLVDANKPGYLLATTHLDVDEIDGAPV